MKLVSHRPMPAPHAAVSSIDSLERRCASACLAASMSSVTPMTSTGRPWRSHSHGAAAILHPAVFTACGLKAVFEFDGVAVALGVLLQLPVDAIAIVGVQIAEPGVRHRVPGCARVAGHRQPQGARGARIAGHVPLPERGARAHSAVARRDSLSLRATSSLLRRSMSSTRPLMRWAAPSRSRCTTRPRCRTHNHRCPAANNLYSHSKRSPPWWQ